MQAPTTPFSTYTLPTAPFPLPVTVSKLTLLNVKLPYRGVYPIPTLAIDKVPVADPPAPTRLPVARVPS